MIIYPAIDLKDGQCVRLVQGKINDKTVYSNSPALMARTFQEAGACFLHVVDLDGAFKGVPGNLAAIRAIAAEIDIPFQVGGGLRTMEDVQKTLDLGAARVIIGTRAVSSPEFISELLNRFGADRIVLGLDARDGRVTVEGWVSDSNLRAADFALKMKDLGVEIMVYTDVSRDGLLQGPNLAAIEEMATVSGLKLIASGGVSSLENIRQLKQLQPLGVTGAIIGKALYDGKLDLKEALAAAGQDVQ